uniref:Uncharacterized protein n=1 Tax=Plectus sambesii TaxID=2011161 RepID=A0A914X4T7_9BILA
MKLLLIVACVFMASVLADQVDDVSTSTDPATTSPAPSQETTMLSATVPETDDKIADVEQVKSKAAAGHYDYYDDSNDYSSNDDSSYDDSYDRDYYYDDWSGYRGGRWRDHSRRRSSSSSSGSSESSENDDRSRSCDKSKKRHECPKKETGCPRLNFGRKSEAGGSVITFDRVAEGASVVFKCALGEVLVDNSGVQYDKVTKTCRNGKYHPNTPSDKDVEELHCVPATVKCVDPQTLLEVEDNKEASFSLYTLGTQEVGKEISLSCGKARTRIVVKYDGDVAPRVENQHKFGSESILLTCTHEGKWATSTINNFPRPQPIKKGTVSDADSIICQSENDNFNN